MSTGLTDLLIDRFEDCLAAYGRYCPFRKYGQLEYHGETIQKLCRLGSVRAALACEPFLQSLYRTLQAWGIGSRKSLLRPFPEFVSALRQKADDIVALSGFTIDQPDLDAVKVGRQLAWLISALDIVDNKSRVVAGSKALHHLLPELVVPMDRKYTQTFFGWHGTRFQTAPERCIKEAFQSFARIGRATNPNQYVSGGWYSSRTKVIDNAVVGLLCWACRERPWVSNDRVQS